MKPHKPDFPDYNCTVELPKNPDKNANPFGTTSSFKGEELTADKLKEMFGLLKKNPKPKAIVLIPIGLEGRYMIKEYPAEYFTPSFFKPNSLQPDGFIERLTPPKGELRKDGQFPGEGRPELV